MAGETRKGNIQMKKNKCFTTGTLAVLLAFGLVLSGCDNGNGGFKLPEGIEEDLFDDWKPSSDNTWHHTFSADSYKVKQNIPEGFDVSYTITASSWEAVVNTDESTKEEYPAGYRLIGTMTAVGDWYLQNRPDDYFIGRPYDRIWLLNSDKTRLTRSDFTDSFYYVRWSAAAE
jgi:hypothetical protein